MHTLHALVLAATVLAAGTSFATAQDCRDVTHEAGTDCIPLKPQRVAVLDPLTALPTLLALGAPVVGSAQVYPGDDGFPSYIDKSRLAGMARFGSMSDLNIEAVAAAHPDLIIGDVENMGDRVDQLRAIAPVMVTKYTYYQSRWLEEIRRIADAVGKGAEAEAQIIALEEKAASLSARFQREDRTPLLSRVDIYNDQPLYYRFNCTWFGTLLLSAGVDQPEVQRGYCTDGDPRGVFEMVSSELIDGVLEGDAIAIYRQNGGDPISVAAHWPTWSSLRPVEANAVYEVGDEWGVGASVPAGMLILDDLDRRIFPSQ